MLFDAIEVVLAVIYIMMLFYSIFWLILFFERGHVEGKALGELPRVTIAIPAFNEEGMIYKAAASAAGLDYPRGLLELIIVDDGSTDGTASEIRRFVADNPSLDVSVIRQDNLGKFAALNRALSMCSGDFFVCLDSDSVVEKGALRKMLPHFSSGDIAAVIPNMKVAEPKNLLERVQWYEYLVNKFYSDLIGSLDCLHVAPGPFSIYRAGVLRRLGGFRTGHSTEDLEIALRLQKGNYRIVQVMEAEVRTVPPSTITGLFAQRSRWNKGALLNILDYRHMLFNRKYGDFGLFHLPLVLVSGIIVSVLVMLIAYSQLLKPLYKIVHNLSLVNFDFLTLFRRLAFDFNWLDFNYYRFIQMAFILLITAFVVIMAHSKSREAVAGKGFFSLFVMVMFYYVLLGVVWISVFKDVLLKRLGRW